MQVKYESYIKFTISTVMSVVPNLKVLVRRKQIRESEVSKES